MMTLAELAQIVSGRLVMAGKAKTGVQILFTSVSTDSRAISPGQLFVALSGDRFDGHDFLSDVATQGAVAALVDAGTPDIETRLVHDGLPGILVDNTRLALGRLAAAWRQRFQPGLKLIAVTGSNGKTTTKEMLISIFRQSADSADILATQGNLNNDIGLPLTLLRLRDNHRVAIVEMGTSNPGEIATLGEIAAPDIALVTNAQRAHLAGIGSIEGIAREKGSLYGTLTKDGTAVINGSDSFAPLWAGMAKPHRIFTFSLDSEASGDGLAGQIIERGLTTQLFLSFAGQEADVMLEVPGLHNARNALAAAAVALCAGLDLKRIVLGLSGFAGVQGRLQSRNGLKGALILDDTYNANPDSVRAAIDVLANAIGHKIMVLGDMGEIGTMSGQCHDEIGGYAKSQGIDRLYTLGEQSAIAAHNFGNGGRHFKQAGDLIQTLGKELDQNTVVLVKGSRFMHMERVVEPLLLQPSVKTEH